jgi:hypothetical protein
MANNANYEYWPFSVSQDEKLLPEQAEKLEFLESAYLDGFESYRAVQGLDDYGAKSTSRSGYILQRGRKNRWEFLLWQGDKIKFSALVTNFKVAGIAVRAWLNEQAISEIIETINEHLISSPRLEEFWEEGNKTKIH